MSETKIGGATPGPGVNPGGGADNVGGNSAPSNPADAAHGPEQGNSARSLGQTLGKTLGNAFRPANKPARAREIESQGQHVRSKLDNTRGHNSHNTNSANHASRGREARDAENTQRSDNNRSEGNRSDSNRSNNDRFDSNRTDNNRADNNRPDNNRSSRSQDGHVPRGHDQDWQHRHDDSGTRARDNFNRAHGDDGDHRGNLSSTLRDTTDGLRHSSADNYLRGLTKGEDLTPEVRRMLDTAVELLGRDTVAGLRQNGAGVDKTFKFVERALAHAGHEIEKALERGEHAFRPAQERVRAAVGEILEAAHLERYFDRLEKSGGGAVRQAEAAVARLLYGGPGGGDEGVGFQTRVYPGEVLRDLRSGAFLPPEENYNPFPLTGRARVVTEMMELMRTLDAIDRAMQGAGTRGQTAVHGESLEALLAAYLKGGVAGGEALGLLDRLLAGLLPTLPGRAGRFELLRLIAALNGALADAQGRPLTAKDGTPLKLDQLLWLGTLGGMLKSSFAAESFPVQLSPLLLYGFDALYSVIGFDGRTLNPPHFAAVQAQVNGSELEWVFGQQPLTEGWMRALIERLKDSAVADHNLLGENMEYAKAEGRFHAVLVSGRVEEGEPVADSFSVTKLLPGAPAFSPA
jgi:hypothetical protein